MIIYDKNGNTRCTVKAFEYHDVFMGECYLSIDIDSPEPISFAVGDYCIFRGEYFYLNYVPSAEKTASKDSRGDAFKYSAMKLDSSLDELTRCLFLDIVPSSYNVTFTGLPDFTFYAQTAQNLADRIQANLDSLYGTGVWTINVITSNLVDYNQVLCSVSGNKPIDASMSISGKTCMEALAEFYNTFKLTYIVRGRTITVAPTGTAVGATFGYGKGNGLSGLKQQTKTDSLLITRLYCYGSTRNIGTKYYANLTGKAYSGIKTDAVKYETVAFQFSGTATNTDIITITLGGTAFHVDMSSYTGTGPIQGTLFADYITSKTFSGWTSSHASGTNIVTFTANDSGIKPDSSFGANPNTMTATITVAQKGLSPYQQVTFTTPNYFYILLAISKNSSYYKEKVTYNGESVYKVKLKCGNYEVGGYISLNVTEATVAKVYPTETNYLNFISQVNNSSIIYITDGVWLDLMSSEFVEYDNIFSANLAVTHLMLPDFPFVKSNPNDVFIDSNNKNTLGIRQGQVYFDGSDSSHPEVYPTIHEMTAKEVIDSGISLSLDSAEGTDMSAIRLDEIKDCDNPTDNGYISTTTDNTQNPTTFTIYLKDVGFDLTFLSGSELYYASGGKLTIRMLSGSCSGREFTVNGARIEKDYTKGYLRYKIVCDRYQDQALNKQFPYSDYKINAGDTFVLLNCRLPNVYVAAASQKLLNYGNAFLAKNDSTKYTYIPQLDEIWMANHPDIANSIKTGDLFDFSDTDLSISEKVFIKTLNIKVGDKLIPTYDLTLDDTIESSTIQKIQNQINNISVGSSTQTNIVNNFDVIKSTDVSPILSDTNIPSSLYVDDNYISSKKDDSAEGHITFNNGITAKGVSAIDEADITTLKADSAEIDETNTKDLTAENEAILKKGFKTDNFVSGVSGGLFGVDSSGKIYLEVDKILVRLKAYFESLEIKKTSYIAGEEIISPAGGITCTSVEELSGVYRCHFMADDGDIKIDNYFAVDDLAISKDFNIKPGVYTGVSNNYYWRRVMAIGDDYIDLSKTDCDANSGIPAKGDKICHLGNVTNADRQAAILLSAVNNYAPCVTLYAGINSYSLLNKEYIQYGYDKNTGKAFHKVYGDVYIGDRNATNYIQLKSDILEICAKFISKTTGKDLETVISNLSDNLDVIKNQTDKQFIIWFGNDTPTLLNEPALDWNTTDLKDMHIDDWYFIKTNNAAGGLAYRFEKNNGVYSWKNITDADTIAALEKAYTAQDSADKAKDAADSAQEDATKSLNVLDNITSDNILSAAEKPTIRKDWDVIYAEKQLIDAESIIYNVSKTDYDNYFQDLSTYLNNGVAWQSGIPSWISDSSLSTDTVIDGKLFRNKWASFYTSRTTLLNNIYNVLKDFSDFAKSAADSAQEDATNALNTLDSIIADNILSAAEKPSQRKEWNIISAEKSINDKDADNYGISKIDYDNNFQSLATYLNNNIAWSSGIPSWLSDGNISTNTIIDGATYRSKWQNYYTSRTSLLSAITTKAKSIADDANTKANSKARVFVDTPTPPYSTGDLWVNANYTDTNLNILYSNDLLKCKISKDAGQTFDILDWAPANGATSAVLSNLGDAIQACVKSNDFESLLSQKSDTIKAVVYGKDTNGITNTIIAAINLDKSGVKIDGNIVEIDADKLNINATTIANAIMATGLQVGVKDAQGNFTAINFSIDTNGNVHAKNITAEGIIKANLLYTPFKLITLNGGGTYNWKPATDGNFVRVTAGSIGGYVTVAMPSASTWAGTHLYLYVQQALGRTGPTFTTVTSSDEFRFMAEKHPVDSYLDTKMALHPLGGIYEFISDGYNWTAINYNTSIGPFVHTGIRDDASTDLHIDIDTTYVSSYNTSGRTIYLPNNPIPFREIKLYRGGGGSVTINGNGKQLLAAGSLQSTVVMSHKSEMDTVVYNGVNWDYSFGNYN